MNNPSLRIVVLGLLILVVLGSGVYFWDDTGQKKSVNDLDRVRIAVAPFQDTTLMLIGKEKGFFADEGIDLVTVDANWDEEIELVSGNAVNIGMAVMDDFIAKQYGLEQIGRSQVFLTPAWLFEGMIFVSREGVEPYSALKEIHGSEQASQLFLAQIIGRIIAVPAGSVYEQAILKFIDNAGLKKSDFRFVDAPLEAGINGLEDSNVAIAAAGIVQRLEAQRRGYQIALESLDLGINVLTGFVVSRAYYESNSELLSRFFCGWYKSVEYALAYPDENFELVSGYLDRRGAKVPTYDDFHTALSFQRIATSASQAAQWFLMELSPMYWREPWDAAIKNLLVTEQVDHVLSTSGFVAGEFLPLVEAECEG